MGPAIASLRVLATALAEPALPPGVPHLDAVRARLTAGIPALEGEPLITGEELAAQLEILTAALKRPNPISGGAATDDLEELAQAARAGVWEVITAAAGRVGCEPDLLVTLLDHAARPALRAGARAVQPLIDATGWHHSVCPACGSAPLLGEIRAGSSAMAEQERVLRCGRCLNAWRLARLRCVGCGESNHRKLALLHGAGEHAFRHAQICVTCGTYLKSVAVLAPLTLVELLEADLATAALDLAAVERGYHR